MVNIEESAKSILIDFFDEMFDWEKEAYGLLDPTRPDSVNYSAEKLRLIYEKYLTKKERKTGEVAGPSVGAEPRFDKRHESIVSVQVDREKQKVIINTERSFENTPDFKEENRYTVLIKGNKPRIDKMETYSPFKARWVNVVF